MDGLLLDKEEIFLPPARVCKLNFLLGNVRYVYQTEAVCESPPLGLSDSIFYEVFLFLSHVTVSFLKGSQPPLILKCSKYVKRNSNVRID